MFWESVLIALEGLRANKMRSLLTMLGIIIGVAAVIAMVSIGMGVRDKVQKSIASLGSNLLIVMPGSTAPSGVELPQDQPLLLPTKMHRRLPVKSAVSPSLHHRFSANIRQCLVVTTGSPPCREPRRIF